MAGDAYQALSLSWLHTFARAGSAALTIGGPGALGSTTPKTRILDGRFDSRAIVTTDDSIYFRCDRGVAAREPFDRLVIAGHNLKGHRVVLVKDTNQDGLWSATTEVAPYARLRGTVVGEHDRTLHAGVNVIDYPSQSDRYVGLLIEGRTGNPIEVGEVMLTRRRTPSTPLDARYADPLVANLRERRMQSGIRRYREDGVPLREWTLSTQAMSGADLLIYEAMLRETGYGRDLVLFDGTRGGYETIIADFSGATNGVAVAGWTTAGVTSFNGSTTGFDGDGMKAAMTTTGSAGSAAYYALPAALDLRGCILRFATQNFSSISHLTSTTGSWVQLFTGAGQSTYQFGTNYIQASGEWYQLCVDIDLDAPASSSGGGFDPSNVTTIALGQTVPSGTRVVYYDDVHYLRKDRAPILANVSGSVGVSQASRVPHGVSGELRRLELRFTEAAG